MWPDFNWNNNSTYYKKRKNKFTECMNSKCDQTYNSGRVIYSTGMHISRGNTSLCPRERSGFEANADLPEHEHRPQESARFHRKHPMPAAHPYTRTAKASVELSISQISELFRVKKGINHMREIIMQKKAQQYKTEHESTKHKGLHGRISRDRIKLVQSHIIKNFRYSVQKDHYTPRELVDIDPQSNARHKHAHKKLCRNVKCSCHCRQLNSSENYKKKATEFTWHARGRPLRVYTTARSDEVLPPYKAEKRCATEFLKGYLREESNKAMQTIVLNPNNKVFRAVRAGEKSAYMVRDFTGRCNRNMCGARVNKTSSSGDDVCCSSSSGTVASEEPRPSMRDVSCGCRKDEFREYFNAMRRDNKNIDVPLKQPSSASIGTDQCVAAETISRDKSNINSHPVDPHCDCDICKKLISDFISTLPPHHRELVATSDYKATKQRTDPRSNISKDSGCDCTACGNVPDIKKSGAKNKKAKQKKCFVNYPKIRNYLFSPHKVTKKTDPVYQTNIACSPFCSTTVILTKDGTQTKIHHSPKGRKTVICSSSSSTLSDYEFPPSYVCTGCKTPDEGFVDKLCKIFKPKSRDKSPSDKSMIGRNTYENLNANKRKSTPQRKTKSKAKKQDVSSKLSVERSKTDNRKEQKLEKEKEKKSGKTKGDLADKTSKESTGSNETGSSKISKKRAKGSKESIQSTTSEVDKKDEKIAKGRKGCTDSVTSKSSDEGKKNKKDKKGKSSKESLTTKESVPTESANINKKKNKKSKDSQESQVTARVKINEKGKKSKVFKTKTPSKGSLETISSEGGQKSPKSKKGKGSKEKLSDDRKDKKAKRTKGKESTESVKSEESAGGKKSKSAKKVNQAKKVKKGKSVTGDISKGIKTHTFKRGSIEIVVMSSTSSSCTIICEPEPNCLVKFCRMFKGSEESVQSKESASGKKNKKAKKSKGSDESVDSSLSKTNKKGKKKKIKDVAVVVDGKKVKRGKSKEPKGSKQSKESVALTDKGSGKKSKKGKKEVVIKANESGKNSNKGKKKKEAIGSKKSKESVTLKEKESSKKGKKGKDEAKRKAEESKKTADQGKKVKKGKNVTGDISKGKKSHTFKRGGMQFVVTSSTSSSCTLICEPEPNCLVKFCNLLKRK